MTQAKQKGVSDSVTGTFVSIVKTVRLCASARHIWLVLNPISLCVQEGLGALYSGIVPAFILTSNPAIQFVVFDRCVCLCCGSERSHMILMQAQGLVGALPHYQGSPQPMFALASAR
jgi:hypothetical protein